MEQWLYVSLLKWFTCIPQRTSQIHNYTACGVTVWPSKILGWSVFQLVLPNIRQAYYITSVFLENSHDCITPSVYWYGSSNPKGDHSRLGSRRVAFSVTWKWLNTPYFYWHFGFLWRIYPVPWKTTSTGMTECLIPQWETSKLTV